MRFKNIMTGMMLACSVAAPVVVGAATVPASAAQQDIVAGNYQHNANIIFQEINSYRKSKGLKPVKYSAKISGIAQDESNRAVREENYNHSMRFLKDSRAGSWNNAGEVTALEYSVNPKALVNWWKQSPSHNKFLLNPNIDVVGIGVTFVDGSLANSGSPWRIVGTVDGFGYSSASLAPGDASTTVGGAVNNQTQVANGPTFKTAGAIGSFYSANKSYLGLPTGNEIKNLKNGGAVQQFAHSNGSKHSVYWSPATGTHSVKTTGGIGAKFARGGSEKRYGYPISQEKYSGSKSYQFFRDGNRQHIIMWTPAHGAHHINETGAIGRAWVKAGREHNWGAPTTDEYRVNSDNKIHQRFSNGVHVTWTSSEGTRVVK